MEWPLFTAPSYKLETPNAECSDLINYYLEAVEQGPRAGRMRLRQIPGLRVFKQLPQHPIRALWSNAFDLFAIAGGRLWQIFADNTPNLDLGNVPVGTNPAIIASNGFQLAIASAGRAYISPGGGTPAVPIVDTTGADVNAASIAFIDQYFIAAIQNSKLVQISGLAPNGGTWDPGDAAIKEGYSDNIVRVWVDQPGGELVWLFGEETYEVWQDTGGLFPFSRVAGAVYPIGCDSAWAVAGLLGFRFWPWRGSIYGASGILAQRVSDYGVEQAIKSYSLYDQQNAEAFCYVEGGHLFYVISYPQAGATWAYDNTTKSWAKRLYWNNNQWGRYRPRVYAKAFGMHIVGDYETGTLYVMDPTVFTDANGVPLRRDHVAPYITNGMKNVRYDRFTPDIDTGVGLSVGQNGLGWDPQIGARFSFDRGKTWTNWRNQSLGKVGETLRRPFFTQVGSSRIGLTVHHSITDPIDASINGADIDLSPGTWPRQ